jgi:mRNA deadenylase 3'-5' endonuclease subunit Ccr4
MLQKFHLSFAWLESFINFARESRIALMYELFGDNWHTVYLYEQRMRKNYILSKFCTYDKKVDKTYVHVIWSVNSEEHFYKKLFLSLQ